MADDTDDTLLRHGIANAKFETDLVRERFKVWEKIDPATLSDDLVLRSVEPGGWIEGLTEAANAYQQMALLLNRHVTAARFMAERIRAAAEETAARAKAAAIAARPKTPTHLQ